METHLQIDFLCRRCKAVVVRREGNTLSADYTLATLYHGGIAFGCGCGEVFCFDFRKAGVLPTRKEVVGKAAVLMAA